VSIGSSHFLIRAGFEKTQHRNPPLSSMFVAAMAAVLSLINVPVFGLAIPVELAADPACIMGSDTTAS